MLQTWARTVIDWLLGWTIDIQYTRVDPARDWIGRQLDRWPQLEPYRCRLGLHLWYPTRDSWDPLWFRDRCLGCDRWRYPDTL